MNPSANEHDIRMATLLHTIPYIRGHGIIKHYSKEQIQTNLWKERNKRIFNNVTESAFHVATGIKSYRNKKRT
jgi:hypothetical protein